MPATTARPAMTASEIAAINVVHQLVWQDLLGENGALYTTEWLTEHDRLSRRWEGDDSAPLYEYLHRLLSPICASASTSARGWLTMAGMALATDSSRQVQQFVLGFFQAAAESTNSMPETPAVLSYRAIWWHIFNKMTLVQARLDAEVIPPWISASNKVLPFE